VVGARILSSRGYSGVNRHWVVSLAGGRTVFAKQALDALSADWLAAERRVYSALSGPWLPELIGWVDGEHPLLLLEDLSNCGCAPPWTPDRVVQVSATLVALHRQPVPDGLGPPSADTFVTEGWAAVAVDPEPFLSLRLCSRQWLDGALPTLLDAVTPHLLDGDRVVHLDVRSDNLLFRADTAVLVDWNWAVVGNPDLDLAFWLPSLRMEGGPEPESVAELQPGLVALVAGFFAARAGHPPTAGAPLVRDVQRRQLEVALPWAARALGLAAPGDRHRGDRQRGDRQRGGTAD
jgi:aminoglycoside phosphotransferase (APT) family kinase protein